MTLEDEIKRVLGELTFANVVLRHQLADAERKLKSQLADAEKPKE